MIRSQERGLTEGIWSPHRSHLRGLELSDTAVPPAESRLSNQDNFTFITPAWGGISAGAWPPAAKREFYWFWCSFNFLHLSNWKTGMTLDKKLGFCFKGWKRLSKCSVLHCAAQNTLLALSQFILLKGLWLWIALIPTAQLDKSSHSCPLGDKVFS